MHAKTKLHHHSLFFLRYYILKNPVIWLVNSLLSHNISRYEIGGEISITILVFILDYFQNKLMTKFFKKSRKLFGPSEAIFGSFCPSFDKNEFSWKKGPYQFLDIQSYLPSFKKSKKTNELFWRKILK